MLLAIDVGNTNTEFGVFEGENLLGSFRMMTKSNATSDEIWPAGVPVFPAVRTGPDQAGRR